MQTVIVDQVNFSNETQNYIKAQLALGYTRTGLKDFVQDGIITLHQTIMQTLSQRTPCKSCTITNVVKQCPIKGVCKGRPCEMHKMEPYRLCRTAFCDSFMSEINRSYRPNVPTWQNTVTQRWSTDPWQIAKCFCPTGYDKCTSADDTDLPGLIHIVTNCREFQAQITENLTTPGNKFFQVRDSRNAINHSASMEMSDSELCGHIGKMVDMLEDPAYLQSHGPAVEAVLKLKKVGTIILSGHIDRMVDILEDPAYLQSHGPAVEAVQKLKKLKTDPLLMSHEEEKQMRKTAREKYELDKKRLQSHLAEQYLILYSKISISPTVSEMVTNCRDIAVPQTMKQVKLSHETDHEAKHQQLLVVKSDRDIFTRNSQKCKNIYVKGEPGVGKTFLSQRIALSWSNFIHGESVEMDDDFIQQFFLIFYISLRYVRISTNIDDMILDNPLLQCDEYKHLITRILRDESETYLIVLDGLDEWSSPKTMVTPGVSKGLPLRDVTRRCTILTTTRPWKLESIRMRPTEMDQLIELTGMDEESSNKYIRSLVNCLNEKFGREMVADNFLYMLYSNKLGAFMTLPVLLKYLVCLWHAGRPIGNSQCEIYSGMLDLLLKLPEKESECRNDALELLKQTSPTDNLPACFSGKRNCQMFGSLLHRLSKLAFYTLFAENQESSLVFDSDCAEIHGMSKPDIEACLNIGILSQDIIMEQCAIPEKSLSFLHKTFQEFLVAAYMYCFLDHPDNIYTTVSKFCNSAERVLELSKVYVFMSGICPAILSRLFEHVAGVVDGDEQVQTYRESVVGHVYYPTICSRVWSRASGCIKEAHFAGLSQELNICMYDLECDYTNVTDGVHPLIQSSNGHIKSIDIWGSKTLCVLQHITQTGGLEKLTVRGGPDDYEKGKAIPLSGLSSFIHQFRGSLTCLNLTRITCADLPLEAMSQLIEGVSQLEAIGLKEIKLNHEQYVWLISYLSRRTGLRQIKLRESKCTEGKSKRPSHKVGSLQIMTTVFKAGHNIPLDLTSHTQLTALELAEYVTDIILLPTFCPKLTRLTLWWLYADRIQLPTDLTHLQICELMGTLARGVMVSALQALRHSLHLHTLRVSPIDDDIHEVTDTLIDVLPTLHHIRQVHLDDLHIVGRQMKFSHLMTRLEEITLQGCTLSRESLRCLVDSILDIQHLLEVVLRDITFTPDEDTKPALDYIRVSPRCVVTQDNENVFYSTAFKFKTISTPSVQTAK